jgi:ABC-type glycerol-3-phosphate transport system substrate-binding protein
MRPSLRALFLASVAALAAACGQPAEASRAAPALPPAAAGAAVPEADGTSELTIEWRGVI